MMNIPEVEEQELCIGRLCNKYVGGMSKDWFQTGSYYRITIQPIQ